MNDAPTATIEKPGQRPRILTGIIAVRVEQELYDRVDAAAAADKRTLSGWVRKLIVERLAEGPPATTGC